MRTGISGVFILIISALLLPTGLMGSGFRRSGEAKSLDPVVIVIHGVGGGERAAGWSADMKRAWDIGDLNEVSFRYQGRGTIDSFTDFIPTARSWARSVQHQIVEIAGRSENKGRPLMIIAHSWGTVMAKYALDGGDLEHGTSRVEPIRTRPGCENIKINEFITLGSPLGDIDPEAKLNLRFAGMFPPMGKPGVVEHWVNIYHPEDPVSRNSHNLVGPDENMSVTGENPSGLPLGLGYHVGIWTMPEVTRYVRKRWGELGGIRTLGDVLKKIDELQRRLDDIRIGGEDENEPIEIRKQAPGTRIEVQGNPLPAEGRVPGGREIRTAEKPATGSDPSRWITLFDGVISLRDKLSRCLWPDQDFFFVNEDRESKIPIDQLTLYNSPKIIDEAIPVDGVIEEVFHETAPDSENGLHTAIKYTTPDGHESDVWNGTPVRAGGKLRISGWRTSDDFSWYPGREHVRLRMSSAVDTVTPAIRLVLGDGMLDVAPSTRLVPVNSRFVRLKAGKIRVARNPHAGFSLRRHIDPLQRAIALLIDTPQVSVVESGTVFKVSVEEACTRVETDSGSVWVVWGNHVYEVPAGHRMTAYEDRVEGPEPAASAIWTTDGNKPPSS